jgi:hypothetical protein
MNQSVNNEQQRANPSLDEKLLEIKSFIENNANSLVRYSHHGASKNGANGKFDQKFTSYINMSSLDSLYKEFFSN